MNQARPKSGRTQLVLVALAFALPLGMAAWLYYGGFNPSSRAGSQHGILLQPILHLPDVQVGVDIVALSGRRWLLVYSDTGRCLESCMEALYTLRQVRLMLGKDLNRLQRLFLHGDPAPDKVFLERQHSGLTTIRDQGLGGLLESKRPPESTAGGLYLIDPLGNLVMYFPPDLDPREMLEDIKHLLELSRIG